MALLFKAEDSSCEYIGPGNGSEFTLEEMQKAVGGCIEIIPCRANPIAGVKHGDYIIVANEESKLQDHHMNRPATAMVDLAIPGDYIAGDVVLCKISEIK